MFITVKRRVISVVLAIVIAAIGTSVAVTAGVAATESENARYTVVLDAGHGGADGGMVGRYFKTRESDVNLYVCRILAHYLKKNGYRVVMTRNADVMLSDGVTASKKLSEMRKREQIIKAASPDLIVSVHQNSYPLSSVSGAQVFFDGNNVEGENAALVFQSALNQALGGERRAKSADYYVLQCSSYPSVLVECGFLSNPEEEKLLRTPAYREKVAYALYVACCVYLQKNNQKITQNV